MVDSDAHRLIGQIELNGEGPGEVAVAMGKQEDLVADVEVLLSSLHDEGIVNGGVDDGVDPLRLQLAFLFDETRKVHLGVDGDKGVGRAVHRSVSNLFDHPPTNPT